MSKINERDEEMMVYEQDLLDTDGLIKCDLCQLMDNCNYFIKVYEDDTEELLCYCSNCYILDTLETGFNSEKKEDNVVEITKTDPPKWVGGWVR